MAAGETETATVVLPSEIGEVTITITAEGIDAPLVNETFNAALCVTEVLGISEELDEADPVEDDLVEDDPAEVLGERVERDVQPAADTATLAYTGSSTALIALLGALLALVGAAMLRRRTSNAA